MISNIDRMFEEEVGKSFKGLGVGQKGNSFVLGKKVFYIGDTNEKFEGIPMNLLLMAGYAGFESLIAVNYKKNTAAKLEGKLSKNEDGSWKLPGFEKTTKVAIFRSIDSNSVVFTDSVEVAEEARECGAEVVFYTYKKVGREWNLSYTEFTTGGKRYYWYNNFKDFENKYDKVKREYDYDMKTVGV